MARFDYLFAFEGKNIFRSCKILPVLLLLLFSCNDGTTNKNPGSPVPDTSTKPIPQPSDQKTDLAVVTVAALFPSPDNNSLQVTFDERESGYTISRDNKNFDNSRRLLEQALKTSEPIKLLADTRGNITSITIPTPDELSIYKGLHEKDIKDLARPRLIDVKKIDTSIFDRVDRLKWPVFLRCTSILPGYAKAKEIFDTCARQSCHLGIPTSVTPCIPFQYVRDGCFARAHKMRYIIEKRFHYCSEKVFSYGKNNGVTLAVKANKWGGCCVTWWYHVAPLVRVKIIRGKYSFTLAYVIDPGMFDQPVLLSTWLGAQEETGCLATAGVGSYSIQPSSVYSPGGTTDPNYAMTDTHLAFYNIPITCP